MATTKERILVTLTPDMARGIKAIAKKERTPKATVAARLMRDALEAVENRYLAMKMDRRRANTKQWLSADEFLAEAQRRRKMAS